jgi:hypothetical protein
MLIVLVVLGPLVFSVMFAYLFIILWQADFVLALAA